MIKGTDKDDTNAAARGLNDLPSCSVDPIGAIKTMFVDLTMGPRIQRGQKPVQRPVFRKTHGVAVGTFRLKEDLPADLKVGIFELSELRMIARFSTDDSPFNPDAKATIGIGIKLLGVPGPKILHPDAATCDFIMQNHPVFFVDNAPDMCEITRDSDTFLSTHPANAQILKDMEKVESSVLTATYWGILPHKFGDDRVVKYKLTPHAAAGTLQNGTPPQNYLYLDLKDRLLHGEAVFDFYIQLQKDATTMPVDQATVLWDETASPPIHVATLTFPAQNIDAQAVFGENFATSIWQTLPVHQPIGSIADARKVAYAASAELRRTTNQVPAEEPTALPAPQVPTPALDTVVRAAIYPPIGIARVGNSVQPDEDGFFIGPEVQEAPALPLGNYKDAGGVLKRQSARFRIYGFNAQNEIVAELNANNAAIDWQVHLANRKADWYQFQLALDIDEAKQSTAAVSKRRNALMIGEDRKKLVIDPGPRSIHGCETSGTNYHFDSGKFFDQPVSLGELRTDAGGRLLVLGGFGLSQSAVGQPPLDFANNDGWHDDIADGPVDAKVIINGKEIHVEGAWVVVGPPNYAPALKTIRSLYDLLYDRMVDWGLAAGPNKVSFERHIRPIFERFSGLQWVNQGFASFFGAGTPFDAALLLGRLADSSAGNREFRERVYAQFRNPARRGRQLGKMLWPQFYGDALDSLTTPNDQNPDPSTSVPQGLASLSGLQLSWLLNWVTGDFMNDYDPAAKPITSLEEVPLSEQPHMLTEAALSYCLADAFHPGCEVTWPMRIRTLYSSAFRIKRRAAGDPELDYGEVMTPDIALSPLGPLNGAGPGDLTKWMAVPWQTDTASCLSGYSFFRTSESLPTFWPARVPNDVLRLDDYNVLMDRGESNANRLAAFYRRADWFRGFTGSNDIEQMITDFHRLGIVEEREGPTDLSGVPTRVWVETGLDLPDPLSKAAVTGLEGAATAASMQALGAPRRFTLRKIGQKKSD